MSHTLFDSKYDVAALLVSAAAFDLVRVRLLPLWQLREASAIEHTPWRDENLTGGEGERERERGERERTGYAPFELRDDVVAPTSSRSGLVLARLVMVSHAAWLSQPLLRSNDAETDQGKVF